MSLGRFEAQCPKAAAILQPGLALHETLVSMQVASSLSRMQCQTVLAAATRGTLDTSIPILKVGHSIGILLTTG